MQSRIGILCLAVTLIAASCSAGSAGNASSAPDGTIAPAPRTPSAPPATEAVPEPTPQPAATLPVDRSATALEQLASLTDGAEPLVDDVTVDLAEFTAHFGPIDGFDGIAPDHSVHDSGTVALLGVKARWDELAPEQQTAIDAAIAPITDTDNWVDSFTLDDLVDIDTTISNPTTTAGPEGFRRGAPIPDPDDLGDPALAIRGIVARQIGALRDRLPTEITTLTVAVGSDSAFPAGVAALNVQLEPGSDDRSEYADEGIDSNCVMVIRESALSTESTERLTGIVTHELFHCWHFHRAGLSIPTMRRQGNWVVEGIAAYVGEVVGGITAFNETWWPWYVEPRGFKRSFTMFSRTFDAIGFWSRVADSTDIWALIPRVIDESNSGSPLSTMTVATDAMGEGAAWIAAGPIQRPDFGPKWTQTGPGMPSTPRLATFINASSVRDEVLAAGTGVQRAFEVSVSPVPSATGTVVTLTGTGFGVARFEASINEADFVMNGGPGRADICIGECLCPDGRRAFSDPSLPDADNRMWAAVLGNAPASRIDVRVIEFVDTEWCVEDDPSFDLGDGDLGSVVGIWRATGDAISAMYAQASAYDEGAEGPVEPLEVLGTSGDLTMELRAGGTGTLKYSNVNVLFADGAAPNIEINGGGTFSYGISGSEFRITNTDYSLNVTTNALNGIEIPPLTLTSDDLPNQGLTTLQLRGSDQTLTFVTADGSIDNVFFPFLWIRQ